eukprot:gb/GECH01008020.1/.p1 GENE.gb/GECH01008020.1/~~gb/GECH01008020.1/.p1  ORF type:complete len:345 (+),score=92.28 gb/GECH01008020.1/:1-1035(+)
MCGRAACGLSPDEFQRIIGQDYSLKKWHNKDDYKPNYNSTPGTFLPVMYQKQPEQVKSEDEEHNSPTSTSNHISEQKISTKTEAHIVKQESEPVLSSLNSSKKQVILHTMRWGLTPAYASQEQAKEWGARMFNARVDTLRNKPSFKNLISRNRCVFFSQGFFEWDHSKGHKQPYFFEPASSDEYLICMAGLFDVWIDPNTSEEKYTFTIITVEPSKDVSWIHDRMPAILESDDDINTWLDTSISPEEALCVLKPAKVGFLNFRRVSTAVNKIHNRGKECIRSVDSPNHGLHRFFSVKTKNESKLKDKEENKEDQTETTSTRKRHSPDNHDDKENPPQKKIKIEE